MKGQKVCAWCRRTVDERSYPVGEPIEEAATRGYDFGRMCKVCYARERAAVDASLPEPPSAA